MPTECYAQVRGHVIRVTRLDGCGVPDPGQSAVVVSKRISTIAVDVVTEDGNNIRQRNFGGEMCIRDDAPTDVLGYTADPTLCGVDPDLISLFTGNPVVLDANGDVVGFDVLTGIDLNSFGFALEVWSKISGSLCDPSGNRKWGYTVFPFLRGGRLGGFSFEDAAVQFSITGAQTVDGNSWGVGPYDVTRGAGGVPAPLHTPIPENAPFRNILVNLDPPTASCGAFALGSV